MYEKGLSENLIGDKTQGTEKCFQFFIFLNPIVYIAWIFFEDLYIWIEVYKGGYLHTQLWQIELHNEGAIKVDP